GGLQRRPEPTWDAGVVDENVEVADLIHEAGGRLLHRVVRRHVELDEAPAELVGRGLSTVPIPGAPPHVVPLGEQTPGRLVTESLVGPSDQRCCHALELSRVRAAQPGLVDPWDWRYQATADRQEETGGVTELGACVRAWRERIGPAEVGLPAGGRRRTLGLRREELAALAGGSVGSLVRPRQGRSRDPARARVARPARRP